MMVLLLLAVVDYLYSLQKEIRILESGLHDPPKTAITAAFQVNARDHETAHAGKKKGPVCIFCKGAHPTHACEMVTDYQKWLEIVKKDN